MRLDGKAGGILIQTRAEPLVFIPLSPGGKHGDGRMKYALIEAADYELVKGGKWRARWDLSTRSFYAGRTTGRAPRRTEEQLHRVILGLTPGDGLQGDHINGRALDNRRSNLRIARNAQNSYNRKRRRNNSSGFKGVFVEGGRYRAMIRHGGRLRHLGFFDTPEAAARAYDAAARELHGNFARTNAA